MQSQAPAASEQTKLTKTLADKGLDFLGPLDDVVM